MNFGYRGWLLAFGYWLLAIRYSLLAYALRLCGFAALREKIFWLLAFESLSR